MQHRLICKKCGNSKFVGDPYYSYGTYYVDVTCIACSDSRDIPVDKLNEFLRALKKGSNANKKTNTE